LLSGAFGVLGRCEALPDAIVRRLVATLSDAIGPAGLTGGQMRDLRERSASVDSLETLNHGKTGALFCAAAEAGAIIGGATPAEAKAVCVFARHVGAAFQLRDDLLDGASAEVAGKDVGQDAGKATFVSLLGIEGARRRLEEHKAAAKAALTSIGGGGELGAFSEGMLALEWLKDAAPDDGVPA
jgi:geranylgeranyl pyrophosphate synthase